MPNGYLIFDDTIQKKVWTDENEIICWHYDHCKERSVKGINLLNALNHFALRTKLFIKVNQMAYKELQKLRAANISYLKQTNQPNE